MKTRELGRTGVRVSPYCLGTMMFGQAGAAVTLEEEVLDRIDRIVAPGTDLGPLDVSSTPPSVQLPSLRRRRSADERAAVAR
ncbi:hypothetical protein V2J94_05230 [Streptomyces sp. DSM 41524]|uniref:Aldo/keto reductase n=1 Tax=Streptomyces asiaticus subsp. ignotus TaxID=3098222 RepID=A0ABU7PQW6_9ACTN|nr:hypothetical protein [Streptomyces sp. DSM 41524]